MMHRITKALLILSAMSVLASASAAEKLYKWVDAEGNVHFSDRPPEPAADAEEIEVDAEISADRQREAQARQQATQTQITERQLAKLDKAKESASQAKEREQAIMESRVRCAQAQSNLAMLQRAAPAYSINSSGEREYVDDASRDQKIAQSQRAIRQYCGKG